MKVQGLNDLVRSLQRVQGRGSLDRDSQGGERQSQQGHSDSPHEGGTQKDSKDEFRRLLELRQKIDAEVERFSGEEIAQKKGLHARCVGEGPGLKVLLEDGVGNVVRRMTGDEFLEIREKVKSQIVLGRGKLLDRKL